MVEYKNKIVREIAGALSFIFLILSFSGLFRNASGGWRILDFQTFVGSFGVITPGASAGIVGQGGGRG